MEVGRRKAGVSTVISGSVWESRMKLDEVKGGIKVFNGEDGDKEGRATTRTMPKRSPGGGGGVVSAKRKAWNSDGSGSEGFEKSPTQLTKSKAESKRNCDEQCMESGIKKSAIQVRKLRSEGIEENSEKSPSQLSKSKSEVVSRSSEFSKEIQLRKVKSDSIRTINNNADKIAENSLQLRNPEPESNRNLEEVDKGIDESAKEIEKTQIENGSEENCKEFGVCHISTSSSNTEAIKSAEKVSINENEADEEDEEVDIEIEKKSFDIKEISLPEPKKKIMNEVKRFHQIYEKAVPVNKHSIIYQNLSKPSSKEHHSFQERSSKLQSLVDLIMWKDASRSAFVFGIGSFVIISSSYAQDINISFISVISYLGLLHLAITFLYRSIICRGAIDLEGGSHVVGEEEAIWVLKLVLPYLNEFLLKLRALFCGDPATTMKLAVLLFALARCGSSITIWKVAKWGFFGVFIVPKVCSSYSSQLTAYGKFWVRRFRDAWESCSHKKGVAVAIFVLVWNLSSVVARVWAAFMLFVAFRYYQQSLVRDEWEEDEVEGDRDTCQASVGRERYSRFADVTSFKQKKKF